MSKPAWACGIAVIGSQWADATLMLGVTKYLKLVYGFSTGYVSAVLMMIIYFYSSQIVNSNFQDDVLQYLPHMGHFFTAITFGIVIDHVRTSSIVSTTTSRKLVVYFCKMLWLFMESFVETSFLCFHEIIEPWLYSSFSIFWNILYHKRGTKKLTP